MDGSDHIRRRSREEGSRLAGRAGAGQLLGGRGMGRDVPVRGRRGGWVEEAFCGLRGLRGHGRLRLLLGLRILRSLLCVDLA